MRYPNDRPTPSVGSFFPLFCKEEYERHYIESLHTLEGYYNLFPFATTCIQPAVLRLEPVLSFVHILFLAAAYERIIPIADV